MAGQIPQSFIDDVLHRVDLAELIESRGVALKKRGANYQACCPFHTEKTPSFSVNNDKQFYYCFGCKANGNAIHFLRQHDNMDFIEALELLASSVGLALPENSYSKSTPTRPLTDLLNKIALFYQQQLRNHPDAQHAIQFLKQRGLSGQIAKHYEIGFAPPGWDNVLKHFSKEQKALFETGVTVHKSGNNYYDRFRNRVIFPIRNHRGLVVGFGGRVLDNSEPKYLNSPETTLFNKSHELYGLYQAKKTKKDLTQIIVVEGYMDVIALAQYSIHNAVATLGTAITTYHIHQLFKQCDNIIFCFDGDTAGQQAAKKALEITLPIIPDTKTARFLFLPQGEDPDSYVRKIGTETFKQELNTATPLSDYFFNVIAEGIDPQTLDSKANMAKKASDYLNTMPESAFKVLLKQALATRLGLPEDKLQHLFIEKITELTTPDATTSFDNIHPAIRKALTLLLHQPSLASTFEPLSLELPGNRLLTHLREYYINHPETSTGSLLSRLEGSQKGQFLAELAAHPLLIPESGITEEFQAVLKQIRKLALKQKIGHLRNKASLSSLSDSEKRELRQLLSEQNTMM